MTENQNHLDKYRQRLVCATLTASSLSQEQLDQKLQIGPEDINAYERGEKGMSANRPRRPAKALGVRPVELFRFPEEPQHGAGEDNKQHSVEGDAYLTLLEEGFALHKAFISIKDLRVRKGIVALAVEYAKSEDAS